MSVLQGVLLGILQGVAEFLPISSSGHLQVAQRLFGLEGVPLLFDVFLHLATLCAVLLFFRRTVWQLLCAFGRLAARRPAPVQVRGEDGALLALTPEQAEERERNARGYILAVILATLVTGALGIITEKAVGDMPVRVVCAGFLFTACLLVLSAAAERRRGGTGAGGAAASAVPGGRRAPSWRQALFIGLAQGIGTLPGVSRSGSTIAGALFCGVDRQEAGEFSFIASIPAILGAFLLEAKDIGAVASGIGAAPLAAGCLAAFAAGYASLALLMRIIRRGRLEWFACYLVPAGVLGIIFLR